MKKGIFPCIWLLRGNAVKGFDDNTVISEDPAALVREYAQKGANGVVLFDRSRGDAEHEASIDLIRRICEENVITVIGAGNIRRMEDVKKLIYAGCDLAALNLSKESNRILAREVCERFGKERIAGCYRGSELTDADWEKLAPWISVRILLDEKDERPSGEMKADSEDASISDTKELSPESDGLEKDIPLVACVGSATPKALAGLLSEQEVAAVTGSGINRLMSDPADQESGDTPSAFDSLLDSLKDCGIELEEKQEEAAFAWDDFKKGPDGLLPVVVQEEATGQVLMVAYMNEEAYDLTVKTGRMTYYSRSRKSLWIKGETSGHYQYVRSLYGDCDMDTLLATVTQIGAACHTGSHSCFFNKAWIVSDRRPARMKSYRTSAMDVLGEDYRTILDRKKNPKEGSYTNYLFDKGIDKMLKKLGEENTEIIIAAKNPAENEIIYEIADYLYHLEVVMAEKGVDWDDITRELIRRQKKG